MLSGEAWFGNYRIRWHGTTPALRDDARTIAYLVHDCYCGHPWDVTCRPGSVYIKHLGLCELTNQPYGMFLRVTEVDHDAAVIKKKIIMLSGEWLERCGMSRSRVPQEGITRVEGINGLA